MKAIKHIFCLTAVLLLAVEANAQYKSFKFVTKKDNGKVLTVSDNQLKALSTNTKVGNTGIQQFFMKRLGNGNVIIANVAYPEKCIKRSGSNVVLENPGNGSTAAYEWRLDFAGNDLYIITNPSNEKSALTIQGNNVVNTSAVSPFSEGNANQNDIYRFILVSEENRF